VLRPLKTILQNFVLRDKQSYLGTAIS
jgi:hypothetical protein